jgi:putative peptidoglycan binding protein/LysM domain-containing protein
MAGKTHTVKQGDYFAKIAKKYGFSDWRTIYNHADNAELKQKRPDPNILHPGDKIVIPDKTTKEDSGGTDQRHRFRFKADTLWLRIVFKNNNNEPIANTPYRLDLEGQTIEAQTDGDGLLEQQITPDAAEGHLLIQHREFLIKIGHLDPIDTITGVQARLKNLGYYGGKVDGVEGKQTLSTIEEFQCDHGLTVDGIAGPNTQAKLKEVHGC